MKLATIARPDSTTAAVATAEGWRVLDAPDVGAWLRRDDWREAAEAADLEAKAAELGHTPAELMIIASLIEAEGRGDDMPKISRVIYNRLDGPGDKGGTNGTLVFKRA